MDKRNKRNETADKKIDYKGKDRGDLKKVNDKMLKKSDGNTQVNMNVAHPERGDSECKIQTSQKSEKNMKKPTNEESKSKYLIYGIAKKEFPNNKTYTKDEMAKSYPELRKRIRDRYTVKLNGPMNKSDHLSMRTSNKKEDSGKVTPLKTDGNGPISPRTRLSDPVDRPKKQISEETTQTNEKLNGSSTSLAKTDLNNVDNTPEKNPVKSVKIIAKPAWKIQNGSAKKRKPMIKTIMSKTGSVRIFKAVTFVDQRNPTHLEIKIPSHVIKKQQKVSKFTETCPLKHKPKMVISKASILQENLPKIKPMRKKMERKQNRKARVPSPTFSMIEPICPPTEVAKWAPASIDPQTKPYYEAWVNTTLAAISSSTKKEKLSLEKKQAYLMRSFRKALEERPKSPELFYSKFADENYTGRIKIRRTDRIRNK